MHTGVVSLGSCANLIGFVLEGTFRGSVLVAKPGLRALDNTVLSPCKHGRQFQGHPCRGPSLREFLGAFSVNTPFWSPYAGTHEP